MAINFNGTAKALNGNGLMPGYPKPAAAASNGHQKPKVIFSERPPAHYTDGQVRPRTLFIGSPRSSRKVAIPL